MRVLVIDPDTVGLDAAYRASEAGHDVKLWSPPLPDRSPSPVGRGFPGIERVASWQPHMTWAKDGLILNMFNEPRITAELDKYRAFKFPVFGPTSESASWEINRGKGMEILKKHGIDVPPFHTFGSIDEALAFAWKATKPYCFKPMGNEEDKSLTYVAHAPDDLVAWLQARKSQGLKMKGKCMLQEKVDLICSMGVSAWVNTQGYSHAKNINFEHKKTMPGEFGPSCGEAGTLCKYVFNSKLADDILAPLEKAIVNTGHIGDFDVECGIDSKGRAWPFEFTARFGYPSTFILMASHFGDPVQWMKDALDGKDTLMPNTECALGVFVTRPCFPYKNHEPERSFGFLVSGAEEVWPYISPVEMMVETGPVMKDGKLGEGKVYKTAGDYICCVTGHGHDVHDAIENCYAAVDKIKTPDMIVRNDVGRGLEKKLAKLKVFGYDEVPDW